MLSLNAECRVQNAERRRKNSEIRNDTPPFYKVNNARRDDSSRRNFYALVFC